MNPLLGDTNGETSTTVALELTIEDARALAVAAHLLKGVEPRLEAVAPYIDLCVARVTR